MYPRSCKLLAEEAECIARLPELVGTFAAAQFGILNGRWAVFISKVRMNRKADPSCRINRDHFTAAVMVLKLDNPIGCDHRMRGVSPLRFVKTEG